MNVRERLEFELTYYNVVVQNDSHFAMRTPPQDKIDLLF